VIGAVRGGSSTVDTSPILASGLKDEPEGRTSRSLVHMTGSGSRVSPTISGGAYCRPPCDVGVKNSRQPTGIAADQRATAQRICHTAITGGTAASAPTGPTRSQAPGDNVRINRSHSDSSWVGR
jgi:hypothetical protein